MSSIRISVPSLLAGTVLTAGVLTLSSLQGTLTTTQLFTLTPEQAEILGHQSIVYLDDGQGGTVKTLRISGINSDVDP